MLLNTAKREGVKVGICGQGPSDFPDFAQFLVEQGIGSISVTPDSFFKTVHAIHKVEEEIKDSKGATVVPLTKHLEMPVFKTAQ